MDIKYKIKTMIIRDPQQKFWRLREKALFGKSEAVRSWNRLRTQMILAKNNSYIPNEEGINRFAAPHGINGMFISSGSLIGKGCTLMQQVTVGSNTFTDSKKHGSPSIGDNVFIGAGAKIIGAVKIGSNVRIGANCVVFADVPDNATVVAGAPRVILHEDKRDNRFVIYDEYKSRTGRE